jgi:hypothetical protein
MSTECHAGGSKNSQSMISKRKLFGDNWQIVLSKNWQIYMVDLAKKYVSKYITFLAGYTCEGFSIWILLFG